jgi:GT2 family glycosyltransferase
MDILVSFIVVTYKRGDLLKRCLESIYMQENIPEPYEVIIIDNGGSAEIDPPPHSAIQQRIEVSEKNLGAVGGRNCGMKLARGQFWIFIDDDAIWHDDQDASRMLTLLQSDASIGAVAVKSLAPDGNPIMIEYPHPNKTFIQAQQTPVDVPYFYTMGLSLRAEVVQQVGDYPERFHIYMEEVDLSYRLLDAGYRIVYAPDVAVYHHRSDLGRPAKKEGYWYQNALNKCRMAWRLLPLPYPVTIGVIWSGMILLKTRRIGLIWQMWRQLWLERALLSQERNTLKPETMKHLRRIGARMLY